MILARTDTYTTYYLEDGLVSPILYKVVHHTWDANKWHPAGETWTVFGSQGQHAYIRQCDPDKPTYKRVLAALKAILAAPAVAQNETYQSSLSKSS